jgi:hypothetical protein
MWSVNINFDTLQMIFWGLFFGFIFYYVIFRAPDSDMVYEADMIEEIEDVKDYLDENEIKTYVKNKPEYQNINESMPWYPTLHVLNPKDRNKAIRLIKSRAKTTNKR